MTDQKKREIVREKCAERGLRINRYGEGFWIEGEGVSLLVADLKYVHGQELKPAYEVTSR